MRISDWSADVCSSDLGGYIAGHFHWRTAFFVVGVPGVVLALVAAATIREPRREPAEMPERAAKPARDRKGGVEGKRVAVSVGPGGGRIIKKERNDGYED